MRESGRRRGARARCCLALAGGLALALPAAAATAGETDIGSPSIEELKAVLADLRRRLAEQPGGEASDTDAKLRAAQQQIERLVTAMTALRQERDTLRAELAATRGELRRIQERSPPAGFSEVIDLSAFMPNAAALRPESAPRLAEIAERIMAQPAGSVHVTAYASPGAGRILAWNRVQTVRGRLGELLRGTPRRVAADPVPRAPSALGDGVVVTLGP